MEVKQKWITSDHRRQVREARTGSPATRLVAERPVDFSPAFDPNST
jgi:hypothetical protein